MMGFYDKYVRIIKKLKPVEPQKRDGILDTKILI